MQPDTGYAEAKRLLKKHFGDDYRIATAYIDKTLSWPSIKVEDPEALKGFSVSQWLFKCYGYNGIHGVNGSYNQYEGHLSKASLQDKRKVVGKGL